ncbi:MAG: lysine--tRNA ligase [Candidatus Harrisonbacteria bacterium CG10_big_fil_rev_8_21_14_0_10_40_38]|uniref:Lysine--tRNA ligase n=1 Tax=Candidatus Harrisonbacteria bacterium CG10_big_fil_rev_8_21_14_0_10_40_38 TaxID=1974583 RepID=A0A2H0UUB4_9BACT|nr:MAG: lysine--tRNA ligase [Candidatus Harrisonbacteria bacterium CG10_big_fil_rev_8_21_14_0_10_40_38]
MLEDLIAERRKKLERLKEEGRDAYPAKIKRTHEIKSVRESFSTFEKNSAKITVVGRARGLRVQGALMFVDLEDGSGKIQLVVKKENVKGFELLQSTIDIGDFLECTGTAYKTKRGEESIEAKDLKIISKSLRPLPSSWHGLEDPETRLRKRYLDLIMDPEQRTLFTKKAQFWNTMRTYLIENGFLEVETPVLESVPGGAEAEPFTTHHNALDTDFYLRISLEIALKKLVVAGFEKVFEIGRIFRNEGIDAEHLQDYTQMEFYWSYEDYNGLMKFVEDMYKKTIKAVTGSLTTEWDGKKINWGKKWKKIEYYEIFKEKVGLDLESATESKLKEKARSSGIKIEKGMGRGRLIDVLFKKFVRPHLVEPAFLINPPVDIEPLAKRLESHKDRVERFQVVACRTELGKGFSELNDPIDQRERFEEQMRLRDAGDSEAQRLDEDFLEAMEYGMPPTAGFGVSERLFAILMNKPIRETVFFPPMRPKKSE